MQFDIVRSWKDESYRQSLNEEQLNMLPTSPVGELELTDTDLEVIYGGGTIHGHGESGRQRVESFALICEINIYTISVLGNIALLGSVVQICKKG